MFLELYMFLCFVNLLFTTHSLPLANEVCEGYVFTGVCVSTGRGCLPLVPVGCLPPLGQTPPEGRHPPRRHHPLGRHRLAVGRHPNLGPEADIPPADTTGYGQQAGCTHPTGMHSCFEIRLTYRSHDHILIQA